MSDRGGRGLEITAPGSPTRRLTLEAAVALGALHGPAELVPISSSAHTTLIPWLFDSSYLDVDAQLRKALEVALHAGATAALLIAWRRPLMDELSTLNGLDIELAALASTPASLAGYLFQERIEVHLGRPPVIAAALLLGAVAMTVADRTPEARSADSVDVADALWLGLGQACALVPGISRHGATLTVARWRRFKRAEASVLSRRLAFPVIIGATALKTWRLARGDFHSASRLPLAAGMVASFVSTLLASRLVREQDAGRPLWPYALYRVVLAGITLARTRRWPDLHIPDQGPRQLV